MDESAGNRRPATPGPGTLCTCRQREQAGGDAQIVRAEGKDYAAVDTDTGVRGDEMSEAIDGFIRRVMTAIEGAVGPDL